jgi:hypothetical protein
VHTLFRVAPKLHLAGTVECNKQMRNGLGDAVVVNE